MQRRGAQGFTMTELMVSTVVAAVLMSVLVSLSGNVQKSFGRVKDTMTLQANLRFAMKTLVDDFQRAAFMYSPDVAQDTCHNYFPMSSTSAVKQSIYVQDGVYHLWGNFVSSRDYLYNLNTQRIVCRNEKVYQRGSRCNLGSGTAYDAFLEPFNDGPIFPEVFCPQQRVRIQVEDGKYAYPQILTTTYTDDGTVDEPVYAINTFTDPALDSSFRYQVRGDLKWINPVNHVWYSVTTSSSSRAQLVRTITKCNRNVSTGIYTSGDSAATLIDYLLPPANTPAGLEILQYRDTNPSVGICRTTRWIPSVERDPVAISAMTPLAPASVRALSITLRARTPSEDPELTSTNTNLAIDVDSGQQGKAPVRSERTVVELRNLGTNIITND